MNKMTQKVTVGVLLVVFFGLALAQEVLKLAALGKLWFIL